MESKTVTVPAIGCDNCVRTITNEVSEISGVKTVTASVDSKHVTVEWTEPATWAAIEARLTEIEYPPAGN